MYKQNKKQIDEMFHILLWANDEIKKAIEKRQLESALDILEQCQDAAIQLGTSIEESEGEGFVTVSYIEEFCEEIYQIHEAIMENGFGDVVRNHKPYQAVRFPPVCGKRTAFLHPCGFLA